MITIHKLISACEFNFGCKKKYRFGFIWNHVRRALRRVDTWAPYPYYTRTSHPYDNYRHLIMSLWIYRFSITYVYGIPYITVPLWPRFDVIPTAFIQKRGVIIEIGMWREYKTYCGFWIYVCYRFESSDFGSSRSQGHSRPHYRFISS